MLIITVLSTCLDHKYLTDNVASLSIRTTLLPKVKPPFFQQQRPPLAFFDRVCVESDNLRLGVHIKPTKWTCVALRAAIVFISFHHYTATQVYHLDIFCIAENALKTN